MLSLSKRPSPPVPQPARHLYKHLFFDRKPTFFRPAIGIVLQFATGQVTVRESLKGTVDLGRASVVLENTGHYVCTAQTLRHRLKVAQDGFSNGIPEMLAEYIPYRLLAISPER